MHTITTLTELSAWRQTQRVKGLKVGFVPTMGALHPGHISLTERSVSENDLTVCSIFVNPIQFNNPQDLQHYPRMPEEDSRMLTSAGCDLLFMPGVDEIYPEPDTRSFSFGLLDRVMEGAHRPGHFNGVAIVVSRLFDLVQPDRAYFGLKDYQQFMVIREMVRQEGYQVELIGCPTVREPDGLAMSSRNLRLTPEQRGAAPLIYQALRFAADHYTGYTADALYQKVFSMLQHIPGAEPEYLAFADADTLATVATWDDAPHCMAFTAVNFGDIRLIDNILLY